MSNCKLVAMWIEKYLSFENATINFGSSKTYTIDYDKRTSRVMISTEKTGGYYDLFPKDDCIKNITGVIGRNGSGKTTLVKLFNILYSNFQSKPFAILVYEDSDGSHNIFVSNVEKGVKIELDGEEPQILESIYPIIYYSPVLNSQNDKYLYSTQDPSVFSSNSELNRSASFQFLNFFSNRNNTGYNPGTDRDFDEKSYFFQFNPLKRLEIEKWKRKLELMAFFYDSNELERHLLINIPQSVVLSYDLSLFERLWKGIRFHSSKDMYKNETDVQNTLESIKRFLLSNGRDLKKVIAYLLSLLHVRSRKELFELNNFEFSNLEMLNRYEMEYDRIILDKKLEFEFNQHNSTYTIKVDSASAKLLTQLLSQNNFYFFNIELSYLNSSGEEAIISCYSELYQAVKHLKYRECNGDTCIILLDEIETYLHPEWQRKIIYELTLFLQFLKKELKLDFNFQVILTSHSPFIISDLPHFSVIKLVKEGNVTSIHRNQNETFAGSIFDLYNDEFFLDEFISEFAFNRLKELLKYLNSREGTYELLIRNDSEAAALISLIGDSMLRANLMKMLGDRKRSTNNSEPFFKE